MKFIRRDYTAFVNVPSTKAEIQDFMCSEIADMIVGSSTGWDYDERTPNKNSFISLPNGGGTSSYPQTRYPVLYLRNSTSGAKLAVVSIYMNLTDSMSSSDVAEFDPVTTSIFQRQSVGTQAYHASGIGIAMIPPGVETEFPNSYDENTVFGTGALSFVCEYGGYTDSTSGSSAFFNSINGAMSKLVYGGHGTVVSYGILVDDKSVFLLSGGSAGARGQLDLIFGIGKTLGTLAYDSELQSQFYAGIKFEDIGQNASVSALSAKPKTQGQYSFYGWGPYNDDTLSYYVETFAQDGTLRDARYCVLGEDLLASSITNSETPDFIRWQPGAVYTTSGDSFYTNGDRFKGYLDTNIIRYAIANKGQLFNEGQFCCVGTNLLLKWDPDATDTIMA